MASSEWWLSLPPQKLLDSNFVDSHLEQVPLFAGTELPKVPDDDTDAPLKPPDPTVLAVKKRW